MAIQQPLGTDKLNSPDHAKQHRVIASDDAASDQSLTVDSGSDVSVANNLEVGSLTTPYEHTITVAKSGGDFTTVVAALASITDNDATHRYLIKVMPGVYTEVNPIVCKQYVDITGEGDSFDVRIAATTASSNIFTAVTYSGIRNMAVYGATTAAGIEMSSAGLFKFDNIFFVDCQQGIVVSNTNAVVYANYFGIDTPTITMTNVCNITAGKLIADMPRILAGTSITTLFNVTGASSNMCVYNLYDASTATNAVYVNNGAHVHLFTGRIEGATNTFRIGSTGTGSRIHAQNLHVHSSTAYDLLIESATGEFLGQTTDIKGDKVSVVSGATVRTMGPDPLLDVYRFMDDVRLGREAEGNSLAVGEGGSYSNEIKVVSYNGTSYVDETAADPINFPNTTVNTALYFGDLHVDHNFYALSLIMGDTQLAGGSIVWEYYDGGTSSWLEFNIMANLNSFSNSFQNTPFEQADENEIISIRFDQNLKTGVLESNSSATGWASTSVDGDTGMWIRCRIATTITTSMNFSSVRLKGNYISHRSNGTTSKHGEARGLKIQEIYTGASQSSTGNDSFNVSSNINYGGRENSWQDGNNDSNYFDFIIPDNLDTSCGIQVTMDWYAGAIGGTDETAKMHLFASTVALSKLGTTDVFWDGSEPEVEIENDFVGTAGDAANKVHRHRWSARIDVSAYSPGDRIYFEIQREADEVGDDMTSALQHCGIYLEYREWQQGQNLE